MNRLESLDQVQEFQLERLGHALARRYAVIGTKALLLIDASIASLYLSCIDAGVGDKARLLIDAYRRRAASQA